MNKLKQKLTLIEVWFESIADFFHFVVELVLVLVVVLLLLFRWSHIWEMSVVLVDIYNLLRHAGVEHLAEICKSQVPLVFGVKQLQHACYFFLCGVHLDGLNEIIKVLVRHVTISVHVEAFEQMEHFCFAYEHLVFDFTENALNS